MVTDENLHSGFPKWSFHPLSWSKAAQGQSQGHKYSHISSPAWFCSFHSKYLPRRAVLLTTPAPLQGHSPR